MSRSNWQRNQDWETIARLRKRIAELEARLQTANQALLDAHDLSKHWAARAVAAEGRLSVAEAMGARAGKLTGQQAVRIEELEAQRKWAADRASYWQDIANNLERQVEIMQQIINL